MKFRHVRIAAAAVVVFAVVSACASTRTEGPGSDVADTPTSPAPSATSEQLPVPSPVLDLPCEQLLPTGLGAGLLTERLPVLKEGPVRYAEVEQARPDYFANQQAGGTSCTTDNGEPMILDGGYNPAWVGITALLLPDSAEQFAQFETFAGLATDDDATLATSCSEGPPDSCTLDLLVDGNWASLQFWGIDPALPRDAVTALPPQIEEIAAGLRSTLTGLTASATAWTSPADAAPLPFDCALFFGPERIQTDFAVTGTVYLDPYEDYPTAERASRELAPALSCAWHDDRLRAFGAHSTLAGGEWAFRQLEESGEFADHVPLPLTGLSTTDTAIMACPPDTDRCTADLVIGRNWVQLSVSLEVNGLDEQSGTSKLTALAQTAVDSTVG